LIDYLFAQKCYKTAQVLATEHEQDSQAPSALIAALISDINDSSPLNLSFQQAASTVSVYLLYFVFFCVGSIDFAEILLFVPVQVIAWRTVIEMTYNVSSGALNLTHSLTGRCVMCRTSYDKHEAHFNSHARLEWDYGPLV